MIVREPYQLTEYGRRLVVDNMGLARTRAWRIGPGALDRDERLSIALEALVRAVVYYDPGFGVAFSTYAVRAIDCTLMRATYTDRVIAIPVNAFAPSRPPAARGRAARLLAISSLDALRFDAESPSLGEPNDDEELDRVEELRAAIDRLGGRRARIMGARLAGRSLRSIGRELGLTMQRIQQIEAAARRALRADIGGETC